MIVIDKHILKENVCVCVHLHCILDPGLVSYVINHYPYFHFLHLSNTQLTTLLQTGGGHVLTYCF